MCIWGKGALPNSSNARIWQFSWLCTSFSGLLKLTYNKSVNLSEIIVQRPFVWHQFCYHGSIITGSTGTKFGSKSWTPVTLTLIGVDNSFDRQTDRNIQHNKNTYQKWATIWCHDYWYWMYRTIWFLAFLSRLRGVLRGNQPVVGHQQEMIQSLSYPTSGDIKQYSSVHLLEVL